MGECGIVNLWEWGEVETEKSEERRKWELGKGKKWKSEQYI